MKGNLIYLVYVDDTILVGPNLDDINKEITRHVASVEDQIHSCQLRDEGHVEDFPGIRIEQLGPRKLNLTPSDLINKIIVASNMRTCILVTTSFCAISLGIDTD